MLIMPEKMFGYECRYLQFPNYLFDVYPDFFYSLSIFVISVSFLQDISLSSVNEYIILASSHCSDVIMTFLQIASCLSYGSMVQCQKIYILCFVSTFNVYLLSRNTSFLWQFNAAMLI